MFPRFAFVVFAAFPFVPLNFDQAIQAQWIDVSSLPADVLQCDECRRRLGLPPLSRSSDAAESPHAKANIAPSNNQIFTELVISSRVLSSSTSSNPSQSHPLPAQAVETKKNQPLPAAPLPAPTSPTPPPTPSAVSPSDVTAPADKQKPTPEQPALEPKELYPSESSVASAATENPKVEEPNRIPETTDAVVTPEPTASAKTSEGTTSPETPKPTSSTEVLEPTSSTEVPGPITTPEAPEPVIIGEAAEPPDADESSSPKVIVESAVPSVTSEPFIPDATPPSLTGIIDDSEPALVPTIESTQIAESTPIAEVMPTAESTPIAEATTTAAPEEEIPTAEAAAKSIEPIAVVVPSQPSQPAPIPRETLIVDGVLTSPAAQKIQIDLLKKQLQERDLLLQELSKMQNAVEERLDQVVQSNQQLVDKDTQRTRELERVKWESEKSVQERELMIAKLQAELAGAKVDSQSQFQNLAKQLEAIQSQRIDEILKVSDQALKNPKASGAKDADSNSENSETGLEQAEAIIAEQKALIQEMQATLKQLGREVVRLQPGGDRNASEDDRSLAVEASKKPKKLGSDDSDKTQSANETASTASARSKGSTSTRISPREDLPRKPSEETPAPTTKRRSF